MILTPQQTKQLQRLLNRTLQTDAQPITLPAAAGYAAWLDKQFAGQLGTFSGWYRRTLGGTDEDYRRFDEVSVIGVVGPMPARLKRHDWKADAIVVLRIGEDAFETHWVGWRLLGECHSRTIQQADLYGLDSFRNWLMDRHGIDTSRKASTATAQTTTEVTG